MRIADHTLPRLRGSRSIPNAYNKYSVFRTCSSGPFHCSCKSVTNNNQMFICIIIASYIFYASIVLFLPSCYWTSHRNEAEYIKIVDFTDCKCHFFVFRKFPLGLKQNLWEEDNLSTRDKWPVPNVSSVRRFYCTWILLRRVFWVADMGWMPKTHSAIRPFFLNMFNITEVKIQLEEQV